MYTMPVDMELYGVFYTVANAKSVSKAAEHLLIKKEAERIRKNINEMANKELFAKLYGIVGQYRV